MAKAEKKLTATEEAKALAHQRLLTDRRKYVAEHVAAVLPRPSKAPLPKVKVFELAAKSAARDGLLDQPFFKDAPDPQERFQTFARGHWGGEHGVRMLLAETEGVFVEYGGGLRGIRRAGRQGAVSTLEWHRRVTQAIAATDNAAVKAALELLQVKQPGLVLKLLQAGRVA